MCSLQRNFDVIRNWERFETGPLTVSLYMDLSIPGYRARYRDDQKSVTENDNLIIGVWKII